MSSNELNDQHQKFLQKYAVPEEHYSFEKAPAAYLEAGPEHGYYASEEQLNKASTRWNYPVANAAAKYIGQLKPHHINDLIDNPVVGNMSKVIMLNNVGVNQENLTHAWNDLETRSDTTDHKIYAMHRILRHNKVHQDIMARAIAHPSPEIHTFAKREAATRGWHHLLTD